MRNRIAVVAFGLVLTVGFLAPQVLSAGDDTPQTLAKDAAAARRDLRATTQDVDRILKKASSPAFCKQLMEVAKDKDKEKIAAFIKKSAGVTGDVVVEAIDTDFCLHIKYTGKILGVRVKIDVKIGSGKC